MRCFPCTLICSESSRIFTHLSCAEAFADAVLLIVQILQQKQWCAIYAALSVVLAAAYAYLGFSQLSSPGGMRHHAAFAGQPRSHMRGHPPRMTGSKTTAVFRLIIELLSAGTLPSWAIATGELASGACIALSGFALVSTFHPSVKAERWIQPARAWISMAPLWLGLGIGIFWTHALMGSAKVHHMFTPELE